MSKSTTSDAATSANQHFSLAGQSLKLDNAEDIRSHLAPLIEKPDSFGSIDISGNTLGIGACEEIAKVLSSKQKNSVRRVNFADIFTSRLLHEIPPALQALLNKGILCLPHCSTVDLSDNAFGLNTVAPLEEFLAQHIPLQHLILQNNGLGPFAGIRVAHALSNLAEKKKGSEKSVDLETIICGRNRLENGSMAAWAQALTAHCHGLKTIKMVQNGIRPEGIIELLSTGLINCTAITCIDLQDNTFTLSGAQALVKVTPSWPSIQELGIGDCLLSARGGVLLAQAFSQVSTSTTTSRANEKLKTLRLQYNDLDTNSIKALADAARTSLPNLCRIELNGNKFSDDDVSIDALRTLLAQRQETNECEEGQWGLDDLSDLEDDDDEDDDDGDEDDDNDDDDDDDDEEDTRTGQATRTSKPNVDADVAELTDSLDKTHV